MMRASTLATSIAAIVPMIGAAVRPTAALAIGEESARVQREQVSALLDELRAMGLEQSEEDRHISYRNPYYPSVHGNAHSKLQKLMKLRFAATQQICDTIDSIDVAREEKFHGALCRALSFVKDPAAIPWLECVIDSGDPNATAFFVLRGWGSGLRPPGHDYLVWLTGASDWSDFFRKQLERELLPDVRYQYLRAMARWLHDEGTFSFFMALAADGDRPDDERMLGMLYMYEHGANPRSDELTPIIERMADEDPSRLLSYANAMRHEAFLPWLLSRAGPSVQEVRVGSTQWVLEAITFQYDPSRELVGYYAWWEWFKQNRDGNRESWLADSIANLKDVVERSPAEGAALLDRAVYRWKDPLLQPHAKDLVRYPVLRKYVAGWINLTMRPHYHESLSEVANLLLADGCAGLADHFKNLLRNNGFVCDGLEPMTWEELVRLDNMKM